MRQFTSMKNDDLDFMQEGLLTFHRSFRAFGLAQRAKDANAAKEATKASQAFLEKHKGEAILLMMAYKVMMDSFIADGVKPLDVTEGMLLARATAINEAKTVDELKALSEQKVGLYLN